MKKRDMAILKDLQKFRCMTRDDIIQLHFKDLKNPVTCCNTVLKRLRRDGVIEANVKQQPYIYFASPSPIKKDSSKIPHFLEILKFFLNIKEHEQPRTFLVEPKFEKGYMEPDVFMIWKKAPFFVEIQRSVYSQRVMDEKIRRYENYFDSDKWKMESWQPKNTKVFPRILLISDTRYRIESSTLKVFQVQNIQDFIDNVTPASLPPKEGIKINSGSVRIKL